MKNHIYDATLNITMNCRQQEGKVMTDYQSMYLHLFNAVTDALEMMGKESDPAEKLRQAQRECEEIYITDSGDSEGSECPSAQRHCL